jgi:hypothetical protein
VACSSGLNPPLRRLTGHQSTPLDCPADPGGAGTRTGLPSHLHELRSGSSSTSSEMMPSSSSHPQLRCLPAAHAPHALAHTSEQSSWWLISALARLSYHSGPPPTSGLQSKQPEAQQLPLPSWARTHTTHVRRAQKCGVKIVSGSTGVLLLAPQAPAARRKDKKMAEAVAMATRTAISGRAHQREQRQEGGGKNARTASPRWGRSEGVMSAPPPARRPPDVSGSGRAAGSQLEDHHHIGAMADGWRRKWTTF